MNIAKLEGASCSQSDPEVFFPDVGRVDLTRLAKKICRNCVELEPCTIDAIENNYDQYGIQAGLTGRERARLRNGR